MIINGNTYHIPELDFNAMCKLEDMGVSLIGMDKKLLSTVRGFLALAMGGDMEKAGKEMEAHLIGGGSLDGFMSEINKAVQSSGFFRALSQSKTQGNRTGESETAQTPLVSPAQASGSSF